MSNVTPFWIPVTTRLPKEDQLVRMYANPQGINSPVEIITIYKKPPHESEGITHWRPVLSNALELLQQTIDKVCEDEGIPPEQLHIGSEMYNDIVEYYLVNGWSIEPITFNSVKIYPEEVCSKGSCSS